MQTLDADDADDGALLTNAPTKIECRLHRLKQATKRIGIYMNSDKMS